MKTMDIQQFNDELEAAKKHFPNIVIGMYDDGGIVYKPVQTQREAMREFHNSQIAGVYPFIALVWNGHVMAIDHLEYSRGAKPAVITPEQSAPVVTRHSVTVTPKMGDRVRIQKDADVISALAAETMLLEEYQQQGAVAEIINIYEGEPDPIEVEFPDDVFRFAPGELEVVELADRRTLEQSGEIAELLSPEPLSELQRLRLEVLELKREIRRQENQHRFEVYRMRETLTRIQRHVLKLERCIDSGEMYSAKTRAFDITGIIADYLNGSTAE